MPRSCVTACAWAIGQTDRVGPKVPAGGDRPVEVGVTSAGSVQRSPSGVGTAGACVYALCGLPVQTDAAEATARGQRAFCQAPGSSRRRLVCVPAGRDYSGDESPRGAGVEDADRQTQGVGRQPYGGGRSSAVGVEFSAADVQEQGGRCVQLPSQRLLRHPGRSLHSQKRAKPLNKHVLTDRFAEAVSKDTVWRRLRDAGLTWQAPERQYFQADLV